MRHWEQTGAAAHTPPNNDDGVGSINSSDLRRTTPAGGGGSMHGRSQGSFGPGAAVSAFLGKNNDGDCTRGRELLLCPVHLPSRSNNSSFNIMHGSNNHGDDGGGGGALSQRFHSFGSTPALHDHSTHSSNGGGRGIEADSDPGVGVRATVVLPGRAPTPRMKRDRVMSDGNLRTVPLDGRPPHRRHDSAHSSGGSLHSRRFSVGKRTPSLPKMRPSAAAAFAVGGLTGSAEKSGGLDGSARHDLTALQSYHISLSDVIVVDVDGISSRRRDDFSAREGCRMNITTVASGYFEFVFQSKNAHDVLLAFLQASLSPERITNGATAKALLQQKGDASLSDSDNALGMNASACCDQENYDDMENFTAREMKQSLKREGLGDKIRRRFYHIASQLQDVSSSLTECFCGGGEMDLVDDEQLIGRITPLPMAPVGAPQTPTNCRDRGTPPPMCTPVREDGINHKFSMENTPQPSTTYATAEERTPAKKQHISGYSFDAITPGHPPFHHPNLAPSGAAGQSSKTAPFIPDIVTKRDGDCDEGGPITPVETSESEDDSKDGESSKQELYGHDDTDPNMKLQTVDI